MRITQVLNKKYGVRLQYEHSYFIPFQPLYPLALKDKHHALETADRARPCVAQLTVLLQCFKDSDFNQMRCADSLKAYYSCIADSKARDPDSLKDRKLHEVKSTKDLSQAEVNKLLKMKPLK